MALRCPCRRLQAHACSRSCHVGASGTPHTPHGCHVWARRPEWPCEGQPGHDERHQCERMEPHQHAGACTTSTTSSRSHSPSYMRNFKCCSWAVWGCINQSSSCTVHMYGLTCRGCSSVHMALQYRSLLRSSVHSRALGMACAQEHDAMLPLHTPVHNTQTSIRQCRLIGCHSAFFCRCLSLIFLCWEVMVW